MMDIYVNLGIRVVFAAALLGMACTMNSLPGRGWLIWGLGLLNSQAIAGSALMQWPTSSDRYEWQPLLLMISQFGASCMAIFYLALWHKNRFRFDARALLFSFRGRIPRSVFLISLLVEATLTYYISYLIFQELGRHHDSYSFLHVEWTGPRIAACVLGVLWLPIGLWISLAIQAKRWHDLGRSGWLSILFLIPGIQLLALAYQACARGMPVPNEYGPPLESDQGMQDVEPEAVRPPQFPTHSSSG